MLRRSLALAIAFGCAATAHAAIQINEIYYSPEDPEDGRQFIELRSTIGAAESLANLWLLEIDGDAGNVPGLLDNPGTVLNAINVGAFSTGTNGLFLWRDAAVDLDNSPVAGVQGPGASTVLTLDLVPDRIDLGFEGDEGGGLPTFSNNAVNFLLVEGFTAGVGVDLDTNGGAIGGDGAFDVLPWTRVVDAVSAKEPSDVGFLYAATVGGVAVQPHFGPDLFYRDPVAGMWGFFDSGSGEGNAAYVGPFYANDGNGYYAAGSGEAMLADGRIINVASDSRYLYATPGAENATGVGGLYRGDTNHDGVVDDADVDWLYDNLNIIGTSFDVALNFGRSNQTDVNALIQTVLQTTFGDADLDRDVDAADFLAWQRGLGTDAGWIGGDFNGSGTVDAADLAVWRANFGFGASATPTTASIPEPAAATLALTVILTACGLARLRTRS
jgi:hypothetical protein